MVYKHINEYSEQKRTMSNCDLRVDEKHVKQPLSFIPHEGAANLRLVAGFKTYRVRQKSNPQDFLQFFSVFRGGPAPNRRNFCSV